MNLTLNLTRRSVLLKNLLLDPNNPRFFELEDWREVPSNMYHFDNIQASAFVRLKKTLAGQIDELIESIRSNGYIPAELIIVKLYEHDPEKYVVIEGNRRLAAIQHIVQTEMNPEDVLVGSLQELEVLVYYQTDNSEQDQLNERILQGIRHIGGPKKWGAYQQANLIVQLHDELHQNWSDIGKRLGLSAISVGRYYRACKALRQMMSNPEFKEKAKPTLFSLFGEALNRAPIREWLRWQDSGWSFTDHQRLTVFYGLLVGDLDNRPEPGITNPQQMRQFSDLIMLNKPIALSRFIDGEWDIDTALREVKPETVKISLHDSLQTFLDDLSKYPAEQIQDISQEDLGLFDLVEKKLQYIRKLYNAYLNIE